MSSVGFKLVFILATEKGNKKEKFWTNHKVFAVSLKYPVKF